MPKINKDSAMLVDIQYIKPKKGKKDYLYLIWRDLDTLEKHLEIIPEPPMEIYFEKPELRNFTYNKTYEKIENLDKKVTRYKDILWTIANDAGDAGKQRLMNCFQNKDYRGAKQFYIYPYVFGADYDIRAWYRYMWLKDFDNARAKVFTKGFMDIECDIMESNGKTDPVLSPIDLVTVIDDSTLQSYTFMLIGTMVPDKDMTNMNELQRKQEVHRRELYKSRLEQQEKLVSDMPGLKKKAHDLFDESYPGMEYNFYVYKDEKKMLTHLFQLINKLKLDFMLIWNMPYDIPTIIARSEALGMEPAEFMCHPDFPEKECWFKKDTKNFQVKNKADWFHLSSYTTFIDQMRNYAAIRKGGSELRSYKLTYIGQKEIGDEKLDYHEDGSIKTLSYNNYERYVLYNIKDVLLQKGIENKTTDIETFYVTSYMNITPYESVFKQTVKLRNVQYKFFMQQGLVPGENVNGFLFNYEDQRESDDFDDDEDDEKDKKEDSKFEGALVGNPLLNDRFGVKMFGKRTNNVFRYNIDMDMSRFYPSVIIAQNIDPSTLIFKMIMDSSQYDVRGGKIPFHGITNVQMVDTNKDSFGGDISKEVMDNYGTGNIISTATKWFNLPTVNDVYKRLMKKGK